MQIAWFCGGGLLAGVCAWEIFWRRRGFVPWVRDDWPAWALARRSPLLRGKAAVALVGASRLQVALDPDMLTSLTARRPVMLAVDGCSPLAVLADLAADSAFVGTVICSLMPAWLAEPDRDDDRSVKWIGKSRRLSTRAAGCRRWWIACQGTFACLSPDLTAARLLAAVKTAAWPLPHRAPMAPDRFRRLDYKKVNVARWRCARRRREAVIHAAARPLAPARFDQRLDRIEDSVAAITRRGGRVVFLRLPSSGDVREMERHTWPRALFWDRLAGATRAMTVHFEDYPQLARFGCPDGSHLGADDVPGFTRALVEVLRAELQWR